VSAEGSFPPLEGGPRRRTRSGAYTIAVALLALLAAVLAILTAVTYSRLRELRQSDSAASEALAAARTYAPDMLSYDYRTIDADLARARGYATGDLADHYRELTRVLAPTVRRQQTVQQAVVAAAAVESATPDRVQVLLFMNMGMTKVLPGENQPQKQVVQNRARFVLVKNQDHWLVSELSTLIGNAPTS
jgi:Mce-associated membrane protein